MQELQRSGLTLRWICPEAWSVPEQSGVEVFEVNGKAPGFGAVQAQLADANTELLLTQQVRLRMPDVVHILAYGGATSVDLPWLAARLGCKSMVSLQLAPTLCHRQTLINERGEACSEWSQAQRCLTCCRAKLGAWSWTSFLGPLAPLPHHTDFLSRQELILAGLQMADRLLLPDEEARQVMQEFGVQEKQCMLQSDVPQLVALYRELAGR